MVPDPVAPAPGTDAFKALVKRSAEAVAEATGVPIIGFIDAVGDEWRETERSQALANPERPS